MSLPLPLEYTPEELEAQFGVVPAEPDHQAVEELEETETRVELPTPVGTLTIVTIQRSRTIYR
jgi:hypothetical protein